MKKLKPISAFFVLTFFLGLCCSPMAYATGEYGNNLVYNGDFSLGNTGFVTDYTFVGPGGSLVPEGTYTVANNPNEFHGNFYGAPYEGEYFLIVNGATNNEICPDDPGNCNDYWRVWEQTITGIDSDKQYEFGFMLSSLVTQNPANLEITVEINGMIATQVEFAPGTTNEWVPVVWTNAEKSNQATITIIETSKIATGNDFGIDDIMFREVISCPSMDEVITITTTDVSCYGDMDGEIFVTMDGAKPFNICVSYGCEPDDNGEWNTLKTQTSHYTGLKPGWWLVTIVDANGCEYVACVEIGEPGPLNAHITELQNPLCAGDENGTAVIEITGGTPPFTASMGTIDGNILTIDGLADGDHVVEINDANNCGPVFVEISMEEPAVLVADYEIISHVSCFDGADGKVAINIEGGTPDYIIDFDGDLEALTAGDYVIEVTDANGCGPVILEFTITQPNLLEASVEVISHVSCFGGDDGVAELTITGGTEDYVVDFDYDWNALEAGTYTVVVDDANECGPITIEFTITQPDLLEASVEVISHVSCFGGDDGVAVLTITGGTEDYVVDFDYDWNALEAGTYTVVVDDANECGPITLTFTITEPAELQASVEVISHVSCFGGDDGVAVLTITGGTEDYVVDFDYDWNALMAGTYTVYVTDANGCEAEVTFDITQPAEITINYELTPVSCHGGDDGAIWVSVGGGTGNLQICLFPGCIDLEDCDDQVIPDKGTATFGGLVAGWYTIAVVDENGCLVYVCVEITEPDAIIAEIDYDPIECYDGSTDALVTGEGGTGDLTLYALDGDDLSLVGVLPQTVTVSAGTVNWVVIDENDCQFPIVYTFTQPEELVAMVADGGITNVTCFGGSDGSALIEISGGTPPYFYNSVEIDGDYLLIENLSAGSYTVEITDSKNCGPAEVNFAIDDGPEIIVTIEGIIDVLCYGEETGIIEVSASGGNGGFMFSLDGVSWQEHGVFEGLAAGEYTVYVEDAEGCQAMLEDIVVDQPDELVVDLDVFDVTCFGANDGQIIGHISGGVGPYNVCLFTECVPVDDCDDCDPVKSQGFAHWNLVPGEYMIVVTDQNGCQWMECVTIGEPEPLVAFIEEWTDVACHGEATGEATVTVLGGNGGFEFLWSDDQTTQTAVGLEAGTYTVTVTDEKGCEATAEVTITEPAMPLSVGVEHGNVSCAGEADGYIILSPEGGVGEYGVSGDIGALFVQNLGAGTYVFTVTDANGCSVTETVVITEPAPLTLELEITNLECEGAGELAYASDWVWYRQGLTKAGNLPDADRSDPDVVIGEPEYGDVPGTFFSLGFGGEMIVKFDAPIVNGPGNDLLIVETTFGTQTCESYPEKVDVWVAQYIDESLFDPVQTEIDVLALGDWVYLGQGCLDSEFDLEELPWAQYVYMKDVSNPNDFGNSQQSDGYDINGLVALHGTVVASADVEAIVGGGTAPYTFLWSNGETSSRIEDVGPGTYSVVVTDAEGCTIEGEIVVECNEVKIIPGSNPLTDGNLVNAGDDNISLRAFPNPFHTEANIEFELQESAYVILEVYNLVGERVATLFEGQVDAFAPHKVTLRAGSLPNGIYFYRLSDGRNTYFNKLILAR